MEERVMGKNGYKKILTDPSAFSYCSKLCVKQILVTLIQISVLSELHVFLDLNWL